MPLVGTRKMFKMAYKNGYAVGAFNVNNMEITQGIMEAIAEEKAPAYPADFERGTRIRKYELSYVDNKCGGEGKSRYTDSCAFRPR